MLNLEMTETGEFTNIFQDYHKDILNYLYKLSGFKRETAEDLLQQTFLNFWSVRDKYDSSRPVKPLLITIARNVWIDSLRKEPKIQQLSIHNINNEPHAPPEQTAKQIELNELLKKSLNGMTEPVRNTFILNRYHGMPYKEIAATLGVSVKTIEARISQALEILENSLGKYLEE